jgi:hypothetical protein
VFQVLVAAQTVQRGCGGEMATNQFCRRGGAGPWRQGRLEHVGAKAAKVLSSAELSLVATSSNVDVLLSFLPASASPPRKVPFRHIVPLAKTDGFLA